MRIGIGLSAWLHILDFRGRSTRTDVFCFVVVTMLLSGWNDLHFRTGEVIGPLSGGAQLLRAVCVIAMYAALILPPQRQTNRYGPDPRSSREPAPAAGPA